MNHTVYRVSPRWDVRPFPDVGMVVLDETDTHFLSGEAFQKIAQSIKDRIIEREYLMRAADGAVETAELIFALQSMQDAGYLEDCDTTPCNTDPWQGTGAECTAVAVANYSSLKCEHLCATLATAGFSVRDDEQSAAIVLVLVDDYLQPEIKEAAQRYASAQKRWCLCKPIGKEMWIGPLFGLADDACYTCLEDRLICNDRLRVFLDECGVDGELRRSRLHSPLTQSLAMHLVANALRVSLCDRETNTLANRLITYRVDQMQIRHHAVIKRPQCSECGTSEVEQVTALALGPEHESYADRLVDVGTLLNALQEHVSPITGVIKQVSPRHTGQLGPLHLSSADHLFLHKPRDTESFFKSFYMASGGKGLTQEMADLAAMCEAIERYAGIAQGYEPSILGTGTSVEGAIDPRSCTLWSESQYEHRSETNERHDHLQRIPAPITADTELHWSPVHSLMDGSRRYLPTAYCYYGGGSLQDWSHLYSDSNGIAAGSDHVEATYHGLLELHERDAVAIWWYNRIQRPQVDLTTFDDPVIDAVVDFFHHSGRDLWVLDISNDLQVPVFVAISAQRAAPSEDVLYGFGAHLCAELGIRAALMELTQTLPCVLDKHEDGTTAYRPINRDCMTWWKEASLDSEPYLVPLAGVKITKRDYDQPKRTMREGLQAMLDTLREHDLEAFLLDQSRPDIELAVCKVIVPGLRHFWMRFAPGRLYDVPVRLGWLEQPTPEAALNRFPIFF